MSKPNDTPSFVSNVSEMDSSREEIIKLTKDFLNYHFDYKGDEFIIFGPGVREDGGYRNGVLAMQMDTDSALYLIENLLESDPGLKTHLLLSLMSQIKK